MNKKGLLYILIEAIYAFINILYLLLYKNSFFDMKPLDINGLMMCIIIVISIIVTTPPYINRFGVIIFISLICLYLSGQANYYNENQTYFLYSFRNITTYGNKFPIIIIFIIAIISLFIYFLFQRKLINEVKAIKYRLIGPGLLGLCIFFITNTTKEIKQTSFDNRYSLNETAYYNYIKFTDYKAFVDEYGIFPFLQRDFELKDKDKNKDAEIREINEVIKTLPHNTSNSYTGLFRDKDVIFIQVDSLGYELINTELTPTLLEIYNNSLRANNFSTPPLYGAGYDNEFMANTSLIPDSSDEFVCYKDDDNNYPFTLAKLFKRNGYATNFYLNDYSVYYNREKMIEKFGYDEFFYNVRLGGIDLSDKEFGDAIALLHQYATDYKLMGYWVIDQEANALTPERSELIEYYFPDLPQEQYLNVANMIDVDEALASFISILRESERLSDTVIVLFGDGESSPYSNSGLMFYYEGINEVNDAYGTLLDLTPTVANLWGIEEPFGVFFGGDIFSDDYIPINFEFNSSIDGYWHNKYGTYNYYMHYVYPYNNSGITRTELLNIYEDFAKKIRASFNLLKYSYFN